MYTDSDGELRLQCVLVCNDICTASAIEFINSILYDGTVHVLYIYMYICMYTVHVCTMYV